MADQPKEYQRLPGRGIRRQGFLSVTFSAARTRLWLGNDHLLSVESQWFTESYRRFYFRDIQTAVIRKTNTGKIVNLVLGLLISLPLSAVIFTGDGWQIFWIILTVVLALFLLLNTIYGPTCVCHFRTAVQTEEMPSLRRLRRARKVLSRMRPLIAAAQGPLAREEIPALMARAAGSAASAEPEAFAPPTITPPPG